MAKNAKGYGKRPKDRREFDRTLMAPMMLQGMGPTKIKERLEANGTILSVKAVADEMKTIRQQWKDAQLESMTFYIMRELNRIDTIEQQAWEEWDRSKGYTQRETLREKGIYLGAQSLDDEPLTKEQVDEVMRVTQDQKDAPGVVKKSATKDGKTLLAEFEKTSQTEQRLGDARYLAVVLKCTETRIKLLGLDAAAMVEPPEDDRANPKTMLLERLTTMGKRIDAAKEMQIDAAVDPSGEGVDEPDDGSRSEEDPDPEGDASE